MVSGPWRYAWLLTGWLWWLGWASSNGGVAFVCYVLGLSVVLYAGLAKRAVRPPQPPQMAKPSSGGRWFLGLGIPIGPFFAGIGRRFGR